MRVYSAACPLFVPLAEEGLHDSPLAAAAAELYLGKYRNKIKALILGCTHYPLLKKVIAKTLPQVRLFDSSLEAAKDLKAEIIRRKIEKKNKRRGRVTVFLTDSTPRFSQLAYSIIKRKIRPVIIDNV